MPTLKDFTPTYSNGLFRSWEYDEPGRLTSSMDVNGNRTRYCFEFLNRLSWIYGEWFFYDGITCYFGKQDGDTETVTFESDDIQHTQDRRTGKYFRT
jgi:hypothetical protein